MNNQITKKNTVEFLKKYGYIVALSVILIAVAVTLAIVANLPDNEEDVVVPPITFYNPILNATVAKEFSNSTLLWNSTLRQWEAHKAVTFTVPTAADVHAVLDGTVQEVFSNFLEGTVVVIRHANNLTTRYSSLNANVDVEVGDEVRRGEVIGRASNSANGELNLGTHLRFQVLENGTPVNPAEFLNLEVK